MALERLPSHALVIARLRPVGISCSSKQDLRETALNLGETELNLDEKRLI